MSINVKERDDGAFVYSFSAEKGEFSTPGTLHAPVDSPVSGAADAELSMDMVAQDGVNVNGEDARKSSRNARDSVGDLQAELYQLKEQRKKLLEDDPAYRAAVEQRRYANTFTERVSASKALKAAESNIDILIYCGGYWACASCAERKLGRAKK